MADILALYRYTLGNISEQIIPIWIELKVGRNGQSDLQKSFQKQVEREGHKYIVCYSLDCLEAHFR